MLKGTRALGGAQQSSKGTVMPQALPRVSVIIPTKNRPSDLELVVKTIFKQSVTPQELIIVDQSESDDAKEQVEKEYAAASRAIRDCLKLCYFRDESIMGVNDARNRAMEIATGDVWLFLDDDVELEPTFLEELLVVYLRFPGEPQLGHHPTLNSPTALNLVE